MILHLHASLEDELKSTMNVNGRHGQLIFHLFFLVFWIPRIWETFENQFMYKKKLKPSSVP